MSFLSLATDANSGVLCSDDVTRTDMDVLLTGCETHNADSLVQYNDGELEEILVSLLAVPSL